MLRQCWSIDTSMPASALGNDMQQQGFVLSVSNLPLSITCSASIGAAAKCGSDLQLQ